MELIQLHTPKFVRNITRPLKKIRWDPVHGPCETLGSIPDSIFTKLTLLHGLVCVCGILKWFNNNSDSRNAIFFLPSKRFRAMFSRLPVYT